MAPKRTTKPARRCPHLRPAAKALNNSPAAFSFHLEIKRKPIYRERVLVGLINYIDAVSPLSSGQIKVEDLIEHIMMQADGFGEVLSNRATSTIHRALSQLSMGKYITFLDERKDRIDISPDLNAIMSRLVAEASAAGFENLANLSLREHRILGAYFRFHIKVPRALNLRELDLRNCALERLLEQHKLICPLEQPQPQPTNELPEPPAVQLVSEENRALDGAHFTDSMYVDDAPVAGPSRMQLPQTPPRKSQSMTLNNPEAYPSPQSLPRRTASRTVSRPRTPTPARSLGMPGTWDQALTSDNEMDVDFPPRSSPVPTELLSTLDDTDQNAMLLNDFSNGQEDPMAITEVQGMLNASRIEVEALKREIRELNIEIVNLKENMEAQRKHGVLMKFANMFLRSADHAKLQEATRKKEEYEGKLRVICGLSTGI